MASTRSLLFPPHSAPSSSIRLIIASPPPSLNSSSAHLNYRHIPPFLRLHHIASSPGKLYPSSSASSSSLVCFCTRSPPASQKSSSSSSSSSSATSSQVDSLIESSRILMARQFPQLIDLVEDGTLLALQPPARHEKEQRDLQRGYRQPLLVIIIGTSHVSSISASQVERVVRAVRPQNVVVELCRSRAGLMNEVPESLSQSTHEKSKLNLMSITGQNFGAAIGRSLQLGGQTAMGLRFILGRVSEKLSTVTGVVSGEEFRAARKASEEVGAQVVLGDRPIEITLQRAWEGLGWLQKLKLGAVLWSGMNSSNLDLSEESLQVLRSDDALSTMFAYLGKEFPSLLQPLVYERDKYLAWSLTRSKAVNGSSIVVGVVGRGHLQGIVQEIIHDKGELRFRDLVGVRESKSAKEQVYSLVLEISIGIILWFAWDYLCTNYDVNAFFLHILPYSTGSE